MENRPDLDSIQAPAPSSFELPSNSQENSPITEVVVPENMEVEKLIPTQPIESIAPVEPQGLIQAEGASVTDNSSDRIAECSAQIKKALELGSYLEYQNLDKQLNTDHV